MHMEIWQIIVLAIISGLSILEDLSTSIGLRQPVILGFITGIVMGDIPTGLAVGGTLNLLMLGIGTFGGATIPDYASGAMLGTAFAIISGQGISFGITTGIPIALLLTQLDIIARMSNVFVYNKAVIYAKEDDIDKVSLFNLLGSIPWFLSRFLPVLLGLWLGNDVVKIILDNVPNVILNGLKTAGTILPALGIAILLRYLPIKAYFPYLLLGITLSAFLKLPILGVAMIGFIVAAIHFQNNKNKSDISENKREQSLNNNLIGADQDE